jgi:hypothetical protein
MPTLLNRLERLESRAGASCPVCRGGRVYIQRAGGPSPQPCAYCGALPLIITLQRVPERTL